MPRIVQSPHIRVNEKYAITAQAPPAGLCNHPRMVKAHPKRPFLKAWRLHLGLTLETIAERLGIHYSSFQRWENGTQGVNDATFQRIAEACGISIAELSAHPDDRDRAKNLGRVMNAIRDLDAEALLAVAVTAERMKPRG